jgi:pSer/pThr/pTyr-binding forkhead associated (FHA) protein
MVAVLQPLKSGKIIAIDRAVVLVGRGSDCDAIISDSQKISRRHCCLVQVDNSYYIRDLGSMNGIWVNGARVSREQLISVGDRVQIGDVEFKFHPNARIEQKKTVATPPIVEESEEVLSVAAEESSDDEPSIDTIEGVANVVAQSTNSDEEIDLIGTGQIKLVQANDGVADNQLEEAEDKLDEYEILDDVIPLDDGDHLLLETNEVEIIDEPIIDEEIGDFDEDNDEEYVIFED